MTCWTSTGMMRRPTATSTANSTVRRRPWRSSGLSARPRRSTASARRRSSLLLVLVVLLLLAGEVALDGGGVVEGGAVLEGDELVVGGVDHAVGHRSAASA